MRLFDEERIWRCGASLRDLVLFSALYVSGLAVAMALTNALFPAWETPYRIPSKPGIIELVARFVALPILGALAGLFVQGRSRVIVQAATIVVLHGGVAYSIARFLEFIWP